MPTNDYSKNIVYLSQAQYQELLTNQTITVNGTTVTYNENDIYVTPQAEPITTVKINNTAISQDGIANIPFAGPSTLGVVKVSDRSEGLMTNSSNGLLSIAPAGDNTIKLAISSFNPIVPDKQHLSVFYGLATAAGDSTQSASSNDVGVYTNEAKQKIQNMLGITDLISTEESSTATAAHAINSIFMMDGKLHQVTSTIAVGDAVATGTNCTVVKADEVFVKNTDYATETVGGVVTVKNNGEHGIIINNGEIKVQPPPTSIVKQGIDSRRPIVPGNQDRATFFGLSKAAGVDLANETVTLGTYPETSKAAIRSMIGAAASTDITVQDVQINGSSIISNGVVNIPLADDTHIGAVKISSSYGWGTTSDGYLRANGASTYQMKQGTDAYRPIVSANQHVSVFFALAKAANADLASKTVTIGTYPQQAKTAIQTMLGIENGAVIIEEVGGTTPVITGIPNYRYVCGEVSTISITPPTSGTIDIRFSSGSTATVMTVPSTVKWPEWFDKENLEANVTYEILITDGVYGSVMTWA